jgi:hypothetical protein
MDFINSQWDAGNTWIDPHIFQYTDFGPLNNDFPPCMPPLEPLSTASSNTSDSYPSSDSRSDTPVENLQNPRSKKRRQRSESSQPDALIRTRKTRRLRAPQETAEVRKKGACLTCKRKRKEVSHVCGSRSPPTCRGLTLKKCQDGDHADGPSRPCLERKDKITFLPGLLRPLCWRPNIGGTEVFRRGTQHSSIPMLRKRRG